MNTEKLFDICAKNGRRPVQISCGNSAVTAVPGMEGRLFYTHNGRLISLFRKEAAENISTSKSGYFNPGGDGLWPAPEGTCFGYEYPTGMWRVPPAVASAQYEIISLTNDSLEIMAEIDLINNQQTGIPCRFLRKVDIRTNENGDTIINQFDSIEYIGREILGSGEFLLAPWSLSQFHVNNMTQARFGKPDTTVRDLYASSSKLISDNGEFMIMKHDDSNRVQIALPETSRFVELYMPDEKISVTRKSSPLKKNQFPIDIADAPADVMPSKDGVRFSIYNDPSGFMELEVAGGCTEKLAPGTVLGVNITNIIKNLES